MEKTNHLEKRLIVFREKTLEELQTIKARWAYGEEIKYLFDTLLSPQNKEYTIFLTNIHVLITNSELYELNLNTLFTGEVINDFRITGILYRWENNHFVDPPTIGLCNQYKGKLSFTDGRHRTKLAYFLGHTEIPVAIHNSEKEDVRKILQLESI